MRIIKLDTIMDVREFIEAATALETEVLVKQNAYVVNGKSLMGLFALDLTKPVVVETKGDNYDSFTKFIVS